MSKRKFTLEQISELLKNANVVKCSEKSITYSKEFKVWAVKRYDEGLTASQIFKESGFNSNKHSSLIYKCFDYLVDK